MANLQLFAEGDGGGAGDGNADSGGECAAKMESLNR